MTPHFATDSYALFYFENSHLTPEPLPLVNTSSPLNIIREIVCANHRTYNLFRKNRSDPNRNFAQAYGSVANVGHMSGLLLKPSIKEEFRVMTCKLSKRSLEFK